MGLMIIRAVLVEILDFVNVGHLLTDIPAVAA